MRQTGWHVRFVPATESSIKQSKCYSITSSARASNAGGISKPMAFAVFRFMNSSAFVDCWTPVGHRAFPLSIFDLRKPPPPDMHYAPAITHQAACGRKLPVLINRGQSLPKRSCPQFCALRVEERVSADYQRVHLLLRKFRKSGIKILLLACMHDVERDTNLARRFAHVFQQRLDVRPHWIYQRAKSASLRK